MINHADERNHGSSSERLCGLRQVSSPSQAHAAVQAMPAEEQVHFQARHLQITSCKRDGAANTTEDTNKGEPGMSWRLMEN